MKKRLTKAGAPTAVALAIFALTGSPVHAIDFTTDAGWEGTWNTTVSAGSSWRNEGRDPLLYNGMDGASIGLPGGKSGAGTDGNNLNYDKGDRFSTILKVVSDVHLKNGDMGGLIRVKAWYDQALNKEDAAYGNQANNYMANAPLSDEGFNRNQRFSGISLLDAYIYNSFDIAGRPLQLRLGHQVLNWGESLYFQGVNQINPVDLPALRRPGAELKEALLPIWMLSGNYALGGGASLESFIQFKSEITAVDACGTYWSGLDMAVDPSLGKCSKTILPFGLSSSNAVTGGAYLPGVNGSKPKDSGQFGLALRLPAESIDTEFGLYAMKINARTPIYTVRTGAFNPLDPARLTLNPIALNAAFGSRPATWLFEYPSNIPLFGVSASTTLGGWSVGSELSYAPRFPVQRNVTDMVTGLLTAGGPLGAQALAATMKGAGQTISGFDRFHKTQLQVNGVKSISGVLGAASTILIAEAAFQWSNVPDHKAPGAIRYGRSSAFGMGSYVTAAGATVNNCAAAGAHPDGCQNDGYVTRFASGYKLRGQLEYPQIMDTGVTFTPSVFFAHDVSGYSADGQLLKGRKQLGLGARFDLQKKYVLDLNYVKYANGAKYDPFRDHDYVSLSFSASF